MKGVVVVVVMLSLSLSAVAEAAKVEKTCKAAAATDKRVNVRMCVSQLGHHRDSQKAEDAWGLAKVAALVGVNNADLAADDIKDLEAGRGIPATIKPALAECRKLYRGVGFAFAGAHDDINDRSYVAGEARLSEALSLTQLCNAAFAKVGVPLPQPLAQMTADSIQMAIIATAITCLVKETAATPPTTSSSSSSTP
uniref:Pectinesterase inhibitor domain-containing protein n=1 Tax=Leersia perrieri TaxID=77586 RepID=A0A0D9VN70_9ORYZ